MNTMICTAPVAWIHESPENTEKIGKNESQILYGERFIIEREEGAYVFGRSNLDGYMGYVRVDNLDVQRAEHTHRVDIPSTHIYPISSFKSRPLMALPMMSKISMLDEIENGFQKVAGRGWIFSSHICPLYQFETDFVKTAQMFLHAPYLYGGQSVAGIDCSGLTRIGLLRAGIDCPRDCDRQVNELLHDVDDGDFIRGDIVYFAGHVGFMLGRKLCLNATARHMKVIVEDISDVCRVYGKPIAIKRFPDP